MMTPLDFSGINLNIRHAKGKASVFDPIRRKWVALTPEEHVRQLLVLYLVQKNNFPPALMAIEKGILVGRLSKRFDLVVYSRSYEPWLLAECKAPDVPITEKTLHQLLAYQRTVQCAFWLLTNGHEIYCADARDPQHIQWLDLLPAYDL